MSKVRATERISFQVSPEMTGIDRIDRKEMDFYLMTWKFL